MSVGVTRTRAAISYPLLWALALLGAVAPISTDIYLPAFPAMRAGLDTSVSGVQLTLTTFLIGVAVGQLVFGPVSDRLGRVKPLLVGAVACMLASAVAAMAPNIQTLIGARLLQGLAGSAGMVIGRAIITDLAGSRSAARAFSIMMMVGALAPICAPFLGSLLVGPLGWRGVLWVIFALAACMVVCVLVFVRETHPHATRGAAELSASQLEPLRNGAFLGYTCSTALAFAMLLAYISASPFLYQSLVGLGPVSYGVMFGLVAGVLAGVSGLSARLVLRFGARRLLGFGLAVMVVATLSFLALVLGAAPSGWFLLPVSVAVASLGLVSGNGTALALSAVPGVAGTASGLLGALQFGLAAAVSPLVGLAGPYSAVPLALVMAACAVLAGLAFVIIQGGETSGGDGGG